MSHPHHQVSRPHRLVGSVALLLVVLALIGNVAAFAWYRPYGILRDLGVIAEAREQIHSRYVDEADDQALIDAALKGMLDSLGDQNTEYFDAERLAEFREHMEGEFTGIGAEIDLYENRLRIVAPLDDSPAWVSGVLPGDIVLEIDGQDTLGIDIYEAMRRLKGEAGTTVRIKVRHRDDTIEDITITRGTIRDVSVRGYRRDPGNGYLYMIDPQRRVAYVRLTQFADKSYEELYTTLSELKQQGMRALVLDLRGNGGGLLDAAVNISDMFLTGGKQIVSTKGRAEPGLTATSTDKTLLPDLPLVVLVNESSASASEIVAGALIDNERALVVGTRSYGKGSVQQLIYLGDQDKTAIKLTTAHWYLPSGRLIHYTLGAERWGVDPSPGCYVPMDGEQVRAMLTRRHENVNDDPYEALAGPITPEWVRTELLDDQFAAGLQAAQDRLDSGAWPEVGIELDPLLPALIKRKQIEETRQALLEEIDRLDNQLEAMDATDPEAVTDEEPVEQP